MKRTQVMLEEWQLESLRARARRRGASVSAIVREAVNEYLSLSGILDGVDRIAGIGDATEVSGRDHDRWLSGEKPKEKPKEKKSANLSAKKKVETGQKKEGKR